MSAIVSKFAEVNTVQTHNTSTYTTPTGATIVSGDFTTGKQYLILVTAQVSSNTAGNQAKCRVVHGSTAFAESEQFYYPAEVNNRFYYQWFTVWTAVSGEGISFQHAAGGGGVVVASNFIAIHAIKLSDSLTQNVDWYFNERSTDDTLSTTPLSGATVTFTPGTAAHDWLVLTGATIAHGNNSDAGRSQLVRSGEASSTGPISAQYNVRAAGGDTWVHPHSRVFSLGAASNTFTEQSFTSAGVAHTRLHSSIFVINLNKFAWHMNAYTDGTVSLSAASSFATELQTATIAPTANTTLICGSTWNFDINHYARRCQGRMQGYINGGAQSDLPAGQTTANYIIEEGAGTSSAEWCAAISSQMAMTSGNTYRVDIDGSVSSTSNTPTAKYRSLWGFSTELASTARSIAADNGSLAVSGQEVIFRVGSPTYLRYRK